MKKFTKCLAVLSSAILAGSTGFMSVSAGTTETIFMQENGCVSNLHKNYPVKQTVETNYKGILVTMPDNKAPTAEELGIENCEIIPYSSDETTFITLGGVWQNGLHYGGSITKPAGDDWTYFVSSESMTEEDAVELLKKLKIRGVISSGEVFYETYISNSEMYAKYDTISVTVYCNSQVENPSISHEPAEEDKSLYGFAEISKSFSINSVTIGNSPYYPTSYINYEISFDHDKYTDNIWSLYEELKLIFDEIKENNFEDEIFETVDVEWLAPLSSVELQNGLYSVEPTWGDATNDDVVNLYDAIEISKYIMNISDIDEDTVLLADINRDGKTDIYDVIEVAKCIMEK